MGGNEVVNDKMLGHSFISRRTAIILVSTFSVVAFSILVWATSMGWLLQHPLPVEQDAA
ncbi:hypothetical protein [Granulicella mallensis]|uniref:Uncharacterized protein n=1 Tax=Granulicella mallensis TaxID=940614 RepID=A0A7W8EAN8_9BACT|nr:hypothetical protein [Granulicella mallensis]MBB5063695.1 hypothetical protein [Granulicella mallensis]